MKFIKIPNTTNAMIFPISVVNEAVIKQLENKDKYIKANCYMEELNKQQDLLKQVILLNGKQDFFTVFDMECNVGKTYTAINAIPYYLEAVNKGLIAQQGILIVLREISECDKYEEELNKLYEPFSKIALAVHSDKYKSKDSSLSKMYKSDLMREIHKYPVVLITHENYLNLSLNKKARKTFTKNRRLLIIDESVDICPTLTLEKNKLQQLINKLSNEDKEKLVKVCKPIFEKFEELKIIEEKIDNLVFNFKVNQKKYLELIKELYKIADLIYTDKVRKELLNTLITIKCIYTDTCLIDKSKNIENYCSISVINREQQMWTLENNIILDASAILQPQYEMNPKLYYVMNNKRVLDHSNWNIEYVYYGSTKSAKGLVNNVSNELQEEIGDKFYSGCSEIINDLGVDKTLVVCTKEEHITTDSRNNEISFNPYEDYGCNIPKENIQHFGNITGKNDYSNLENVLITHTINYSETDYILKYMYFTNKRFADNTTKFKSHPEQNLGGIYIFNDKELQDFKEKTIANHFYQAICRVNREMNHKTRVVIISKYIGAILYVRDMLNCKCEQTNKYSTFIERENIVNKNRHDNSKSSKMKNLFNDIMQSNIPHNIQYKKLDDYIIQIDREQIQKFLKYNDNKFSKSIYDCKDYMKDYAVLYFKKNFVFILNRPLT